MSQEPVRRFETLSKDDVAAVGGKNASLGEMIQQLQKRGVRLPGGFAVTASAYRAFIEHNDLHDKIREAIDAMHAEKASLEETGTQLRRMFRRGDMPDDVAEATSKAYEEMCSEAERDDMDVAVRSSATAEDLPEASFAGQQETFLNVSGDHELLEAVQKCFASLFTDRAISYREEHGFDHLEVALSVGVQRMVRSDKACSGVMFSIDTETGFPHAVVIDGAWGLGETVVQGTVTPDEFRVYKPFLDNETLVPIVEKTLGAKETRMVYATGGTEKTRTERTSTDMRMQFVLQDAEILTLARWAKII